MSHYYDVVLVGEELAGLWAAALLARRGFRVLVLRRHEREEAYTEGNQTFSTEPLPLLGIDGPAWRRVLGELNLAQSLRRRLVAQDPPYQIVLPSHRIDGDPERLSAELDRELPRSREKLDAFYARAADLGRVIDPILTQDVTLPPDGFWERRELARLRPHLPSPEEDVLAGMTDPEARAIPAVIAAFSCTLAAPGPVSTLRTNDLWRRGAFRLPGGAGALRALLHERIKTCSGELVEAEIQELAFKRGKLTGVVTRGRGEALGCGFLLAAMDLSELTQLLGEETPRRMNALAAQLRPTRFRYVLQMVVASEGLPEGMGENVFLIGDPSAPLEEENALALCVRETDSPGRSCLSVVALTRSNDPVRAAALGARIRAQLEAQLLPFLERHLVSSHSPHEGEQARPMTPLAQDEDLGPLGVGGLPSATGIKNVYQCSRQTLPGLGIEGELAAAWSAARLISRSEKKFDPLKDDVLRSG